MPSIGSAFRIKLEFDTPPPGMPSSRKYVILIKADVCKTIYDLEHTIIRKFGFSKGATITLALDGFVLISTEDVNVLSNDDFISVNIHQDCREDEISSTGKKRKICDKSKVATEKVVKSVNQNGMGKKAKNSMLSKTKTKPKAMAVKKRKASTSEDSSDNSSTEIEKAKKRPKRVVIQDSCINATVSEIRTVKTAVEDKKKSSTTTCSDGLMTKNLVLPEESKALSTPFKSVAVNQKKPSTKNDKKSKERTPKGLGQTKTSSANHITFSSSSSDSEMDAEAPAESDALQTPLTSLKEWLSSGKNGHNHSPNYYNSYKDPGVSTNVSVIYENPAVADDAENKIEKKQEPPTRNYSELLPSTWPPRVGDIIAYKILEMSEDYTPVISEYKEAKILEILPSSTSPLGVDAVKMQYLWPQQDSKKREGGRFEMDLSEDEQSDDDLTLEWQSLLEPKRID